MGHACKEEPEARQPVATITKLPDSTGVVLPSESSVVAAQDKKMVHTTKFCNLLYSGVKRKNVRLGVGDFMYETKMCHFFMGFCSSVFM